METCQQVAQPEDKGQIHGALNINKNVTCICKNMLSVKHILLECPSTTELFHKNGYDFNAVSYTHLTLPTRR